MPRYFFDTDDGSLCIADDEGHAVAAPVEAHRLALRTLAEMMGDRLTDDFDQGISLAMRDDAGRIVYRAKIRLRAEWDNATGTGREASSDPA